MYSVRLGDLLNEFATRVNNGEFKKMPYHDWRLLKKHEEEYVRVERDGWGDLNIINVNNNEILTECWPYNDESFGTYLDDVYICEFNCGLANKVYVHSASTSSNTNYGIATMKQDKAIPAVEITEKGINIQGKSVNDTIIEKVNEAAGFSINRKENNSMNLFKNFDFGSCENDNVKMSMYGIAVKNANGTWVSYDAKSENVVDVDILNFDAKYLYKMPVAIKDVKVGDVVIHNRKPMFVTVVEGGKLGAIDPAAGEEKVILLTKSMFGFDFVTKVVNLFGDLSATASADAPFGNMLPLMLLADGGKSDDMLPLMFAMGGGKFDMSNPMMLYFLAKDNKNKDILPFMFFANGQGIAFGKTEAEARNNALNA